LAESIKEENIPEELPNETKNIEGYCVQVASFEKNESALKEAENLKKSGYPVLIIQKGKYSVVYAGRFKEEKEAKTSLNKLKAKYKDCVLRRL